MRSLQVRIEIAAVSRSRAWSRMLRMVSARCPCVSEALWIISTLRACTTQR